MDADTSLYTVLNSQMRRIDLFCKLIGPLVISIIDGLATQIALLVTLGLTLVSVGIEYLAIAQVLKKETNEDNLLITSHIYRCIEGYQPLASHLPQAPKNVSILNSQTPRWQISPRVAPCHLSALTSPISCYIFAIGLSCHP